MGTLVAHLAPVQLPEMVHQVVQVTQTLELREDKQVLSGVETLPLSQGSGDLVLSPSSTG